MLSRIGQRLNERFRWTVLADWDTAHPRWLCDSAPGPTIVGPAHEESIAVSNLALAREGTPNRGPGLHRTPDDPDLEPRFRWRASG